MDFDTWEPVYAEILADFGYERVADERARDWLATRCRPFDLSRIDVAGEAVCVAGAGPSLASEVDRARSADAVFAASTAVDMLADAGVAVDVQVTDLDKNPWTTRRLAAEGTPVAVHAHGDNLDDLRAVVPRLDLDNVLGTTQAAPRGPVRNFGGFTDGDRAAFLADHLGADSLTFAGWDLDDSSTSPEKRRKLAWATRLLQWLEARRDERFSVLEGRRDRGWRPPGA